MQQSLVDSGIEGVGGIPWGSHCCQFYETGADLADLLVPFFAAGLRGNERCLWVTSAPLKADDARASLRRAVPDLAAHEARGDIQIIDYREWYEATGRTDADATLEAWSRREQQAIDGGYAGLRLTGNTFWLEPHQWDEFVQYEQRVNEVFGPRRIVGLCSYCLSRTGTQGMLDVVRNHDFALVRRHGAWEMIESTSLKVAKEELRQLNAQLEQRVLQRTAELESALRTRDEFLAVASHELKTPIASFRLYLDTTLRGLGAGTLPATKVADRIRRAQEQSVRLEQLVNDLLDVSRFAHGTEPLELRRTRADLASLVRGCAARLLPQLQHAGVALEVACEDGLVARVDALRIEQVVTNLLSNVVRYAPGAPATVRLAREDGQAVLTVTDGGPGIPESDRAFVFDRFTQLGASRHGGFGLGLWIVKRIVDASGGTVTLGDGAAGGARFTVRLPLPAGQQLH